MDVTRIDVPEGVALGVGDGVALGVGEGVGLGVGDGVVVGAGVGFGVAAGVGVGVGDAVGAGVGVGAAVGAGVGVGVATGEDVGVADGLALAVVIETAAEASMTSPPLTEAADFLPFDPLCCVADSMCTPSVVDDGIVTVAENVEFDDVRTVAKVCEPSRRSWIHWRAGMPEPFTVS